MTTLADLLVDSVLSKPVSLSETILPSRLGELSSFTAFQCEETSE